MSNRAYIIELAFRLVPASHSSSDNLVNYRVFGGDVSWQDGKIHRVVAVLIQYGRKEIFEEARKEINFSLPPHIALADFPYVVAAMSEVARELNNE